MAHFNSLTLVGPPASGLERAATILEESHYAGQIVIPQLVLTEPFHPGADVFAKPVVIMSEKEFDANVDKGTIDLHWERITDIGMPVEKFGYFSLPAEDYRLPVRIANSYIARNENPSTETAMRTTLFAVFNASWAIRLARLTERLGTEQKAKAFMKAQSRDLDLIPYGIGTTVTIDTGIDINTGQETDPDHGKNELRKILDRLLYLREAQP